MARTTSARAVAHDPDGERLHQVMFEVAYALNDNAGFTREMQWAQAKPGEQLILLDAGQAAARRGEMPIGTTIFSRAVEAGAKKGLGDWVAAPYARLLDDVGLTAQARQKLAEPSEPSAPNDYQVATAAFGDTGRAEKLLRGAVAKSPGDTVLMAATAPLV